MLALRIKTPPVMISKAVKEEVMKLMKVAQNPGDEVNLVNSIGKSPLVHEVCSPSTTCMWVIPSYMYVLIVENALGNFTWKLSVLCVPSELETRGPLLLQKLCSEYKLHSLCMCD